MRHISPLERLALILLATLAMCGGSAPGSWSAPPAVDLILEIRATNGERCHGTPVGIVQILTADHCMGSGVFEWRGQGLQGSARMLWRDPKRDLAMLITDGDPPMWRSVQIGKDKPQRLETLYWRLYLEGFVSVVESGHFLGVDQDGQMIASGFFAPGTSGSGIINAEGEVVGVASGAWNAASRSPKALYFPPGLVGIAVNKWPKP